MLGLSWADHKDRHNDDHQQFAGADIEHGLPPPASGLLGVGGLLDLVGGQPLVHRLARG